MAHSVHCVYTDTVWFIIPVSMLLVISETIVYLSLLNQSLGWC